MMHWKKHGIVYKPDGKNSWSLTHAMIPTPYLIDEKRLRVFITTCDASGVGRIGYVDVSAINPKIILSVCKSPLLDIGSPGTFDENGVLCCSVVNDGNGNLLMYYVGFELGTKIRYRLLTGLAVSQDKGETFTRVKKTPVLERSDREIYFRAGPHCIKDNLGYRMWYVGGDEWVEINGKSMPVYDIRYIESKDGIHWPDQGEVQINITNKDEHGFGRPYVIQKERGGHRIFYSVRRISHGSYRMGYAESEDGRKWIRMDDQLNLDVSPGEFDSDAIMYAAPIKIGRRLYVFYNGNDFGKEGFGVAELISE